MPPDKPQRRRGIVQAMRLRPPPAPEPQPQPAPERKKPGRPRKKA